MATVIITGGTGLIGKALAAELVDQYDVVVLSRKPKKYEGKMPATDSADG